MMAPQWEQERRDAVRVAHVHHRDRPLLTLHREPQGVVEKPTQTGGSLKDSEFILEGGDQSLLVPLAIHVHFDREATSV